MAPLDADALLVVEGGITFKEKKRSYRVETCSFVNN
jgi:hypothetical protein